jgi:hypothetical protein
MKDETAWPRNACGQAMWTLVSGRDEAARGAWSQALAHAADCPACSDRLGRLATAMLSGAPDATPCAECQARLPAWLAVRASGEDPAPTYPRTAAHLADCPRCATVMALLAPAATGWAGEGEPEPPHYPRFDTSFLDGDPAHSAIRGLVAWWTGLLERAIAPPAERPRESPVSVVVLGLATVVIAVLALAAGTWVVLQPKLLPLPLAPVWGAVTPTTTAPTSATATPTATTRAPRATAGPPAVSAPGAAMTAPATTDVPSPPPRPTKRRDQPPPAPTAGATSEPYPGWQEPPTREPYPGPSEAPTGAAYPGPTEDPQATATPNP